MKAIDERKDLQELEKERKVISYLPSYSLPQRDFPAERVERQ